MPVHRHQQVAQALRKLTTFSEHEIVLLRAAKALRTSRGMYRNRYVPEEVEIMARARQIALNGGQVQLARFLILRTVPGTGEQRTVILTGSGEVHRCPRCGRLHRAPRVKLSTEELAREAAVLEKALLAARAERKS
jgi:hypothetical protein